MHVLFTGVGSYYVWASAKLYLTECRYTYGSSYSMRRITQFLEWDLKDPDIDLLRKYLDKISHK